MNRKQRRKAGIETPVKTYTLNETQIQQLKDAAISEAIDRTIKIQLYTSIMVLRDYNGFGKKRLTEFAENWTEIMDSIQNDYLDYKDMIDVIEEETGLRLEF